MKKLFMSKQCDHPLRDVMTESTCADLLQHQAIFSQESEFVPEMTAEYNSNSAPILLLRWSVSFLLRTRFDSQFLGTGLPRSC